MYLEENARREKRQTLFAALGIALAVMVLAPPIVQAAVRRVKVVNTPLPVTGAVKVKNGSAVDSQTYEGGTNNPGFGKLPNGAAQFPTRGISVRTTGGGGGLFGIGACEDDDGDDIDQADDFEVAVPASGPGNPPNIVTGIIIGASTADPQTVTIATPDLPSGHTPVIALRTTAEKPTEFIGLGNGLTATPSEIEFRCTDATPTGTSFAVIGQ